MTKSKILFIANTAWSMYNFRKNLLQRLIKDGYKVEIICPFEENFMGKLTKLGCVCHQITMSAKGVNPFKNLKLVYDLYRLIKHIAPDFIFCYTIKPNIFGSIAAGIAKIPSIAITTGLGYTFLHKNLVSRISGFLYKFALIFPREVWFLNNDDLQTFRALNLVSAEKAKILRGEGIDLQRFNISSLEQPDNVIRFLAIARMLWDKGINEFILAAQEIKKKFDNVEFQLLGFVGTSNPQAIPMEQIKSWAEQGIAHYLGATGNVIPFIQKASCIVLPSYYREGIPISLLEGAAMGKPIITSNTAGCKDTVTDGITGYLCEPRDVDSLVSAMKKIILLDKSERLKMGLMGRKKMEKEYDVQIVIEHYLTTLERNLGS